jgi:group I intron endonuclease
MANIYKITNKINAKSYIGKTKLSVEERFKQHKKESNKERCKHRPLYKAINKYGIENFKFELLEETDSPEEKEIYYIKKYNTYGKTGYNATKGGDGKSYLNLDKKEVIDLYHKTKSIYKVGELLNIDAKTVLNIIKDNHITLYSRHNRYYCKGVYCITLKRSFASVAKAARFIIFYNLSTANFETIKRCIHRVIDKKCSYHRPSYLGLEWVAL